MASLQLASPAEIANSEGTLEGAWLVTGDDREAGFFYEAFNKMFPGTKAFSETVYAYDLAKMLIEGAILGDINGYFHTVKDFNGALGKYGSNGKNSFQFNVVVKEVTKDGFRYVE